MKIRIELEYGNDGNVEYMRDLNLYVLEMGEIILDDYDFHSIRDGKKMIINNIEYKVKDIIFLLGIGDNSYKIILYNIKDDMCDIRSRILMEVDRSVINFN